MNINEMWDIVQIHFIYSANVNEALFISWVVDYTYMYYKNVLPNILRYLYFITNVYM